MNAALQCITDFILNWLMMGQFSSKISGIVAVLTELNDSVEYIWINLEEILVENFGILLFSPNSWESFNISKQVEISGKKS